MKKCFAILCAVVIAICSLPLTVLAIGEGNMDGGGGGQLGEGTNKNVWSEISHANGTRREGVRVTVVDAKSGARAAPSIDYTNTTTVDNVKNFPLSGALNFGKSSKVEYKNGKSLVTTDGYTYKNPEITLPTIISNGGNIAAIKSYFTDADLLHMLAADTGMDYNVLISGKYKLLVEPMVYIIYQGYAYAATATELALFDKAVNGDVRRYFVSLSHNLLPFSIFLETPDLGFPAYSGGTGSGIRASNELIISTLGIGIVKFGNDTSIDFDFMAGGKVITKAKPDDSISIQLQCTNTSDHEVTVPVTFTLDGVSLFAADITIGANATVTQDVPYKIPKGAKGSITGVARINWEKRTEESNPDNNEAIKSLEITDKDEDVTIDWEKYDYRTDTDVITAVTLHTGDEIAPDDPATVTFTIPGVAVYNVGNVVIPKGGSQIVWVKWHTPKQPQDMTITVTTSVGSLSKVLIPVKIGKLVEKTPSNPTADDKKPGGWSQVAVPEKKAVTEAEWTVWTADWEAKLEWKQDWRWMGDHWQDFGSWEDNGAWAYSLEYYAASLSAKEETMPDEKVPTAKGKEMKSGYGVDITTLAKLLTNAPLSHFADAQNVVTYFPEFQYKTYFRVSETSGHGKFELKKNKYSTYNQRVHFTPIWFPDSTYTVYSYVFDCWTPKGMLSYNAQDYVIIKGDVYKDWHIAPLPVR